MRSWPSLTAEAVCFARALEHRRPPHTRLVSDPYARHFLRRGGRTLVRATRLAGRAADLAEDRLTPGAVSAVAARHGWIDARLEAALAHAEQVLILGAGYDARAWRFADQLDGRLVVEVDHPATQARKRRRIRRAGLPDAAVLVSADLAREPLDEVLARTPLRRGAPTVIVWEGVAMYLEPETVRHTLAVLRDFAGPGSRVLLDLWNGQTGNLVLDGAGAALGAGLGALGEPIRFRLPQGGAGELMSSSGWRLSAWDDVDGIARRWAGRAAAPFVLMVEGAADADGTPVGDPG